MKHFFQVLRLLLLAASVSIFSGCAAYYVDGHQPEVTAAEYKKPAAPSDVQLIWEFQTKGVANARATEFLKSRVQEQLAASGLFATVSDAPVKNGALLTVTVNNIPITDDENDAFRKGFIAGLTFGIAGQTVGDGYECKLRYSTMGTNTIALERSNKHIIYTSIGNSSPPPNAQKMNDIEQAVTTMLRQLISRTLKDLSQDAAFP